MISGPYSFFDTLKILNGEATYLSEHIERTHETLHFLSVVTSVAEVTSLYKKIHVEILMNPEYPEKNICRIDFDPLQWQRPTYKLRTLPESSQPVKLEVIKLNQAFDLSKILSPTGNSNYKWSQRQHWDSLWEIKNSSADDILIVDKKLQIVETSRCNVFFKPHTENILWTPSLLTGCLNGVFRRYVLKNKKIKMPNGEELSVIEKDITLTDLPRCNVYVGNSIYDIRDSKIFYA